MLAPRTAVVEQQKLTAVERMEGMGDAENCGQTWWSPCS